MYTFPIDLFPSKLLQTVASTLNPLTTGFLVILEGDILPDITHTFWTQVWQHHEKTVPIEDTFSRNEDIKTSKMVTPSTLPQDDATLAYDDQGIGYARSWYTSLIEHTCPYRCCIGNHRWMRTLPFGPSHYSEQENSSLRPPLLVLMLSSM